MNKRAILSALRSRQTLRYLRDARRYRRRNKRPQFRIDPSEAYPIVRDFHREAGTAKGHYFHQDLWAARLIYERRPNTHLDIGSRIDGLIAHLLTFMPVTVVDIRPLASVVSRLSFVQADATTLDDIEDGSVDSISSLHAVEHFGLGRYGDAINPEGCFHAMEAMARVLAVGGRLYLSVPIGRERLQFNAHRIFNPNTVLDAYKLPLVSFAAVDDRGNLHRSCRSRCFRRCNLFLRPLRIHSLAGTRLRRPSITSSRLIG